MNDITPILRYAAPVASRNASWAAAFQEMVEAVMVDGDMLDVPLPYAELRRLLSEWYGVLTDVTIPQLVHWDLWDGNIIVDPATRQIAGVIDFERALCVATRSLRSYSASWLSRRTLLPATDEECSRRLAR